jgi:hypothetical protein
MKYAIVKKPGYHGDRNFLSGVSKTRENAEKRCWRDEMVIPVEDSARKGNFIWGDIAPDMNDENPTYIPD